MNVRGWITQEKFIVGATPRQMEDLLGLPKGRCSMGVMIVALTRFPEMNEFKFGGFTQFPNGRPVGGRDSEIVWTKGLVVRQKEMTRQSWSLSGCDRLVKVLPIRSSAPDDVYPPGQGVKQWKLIAEVPAIEIARLGPDEQYLPYSAKKW